MAKNKMKGLVMLLMLFVGSFAAQAQMQQQLQPLPIDPAVRVGKLSNGLTYIIRHNAQPKNRAHFYIAQKVGSILEEDNQAGLAHFLEHMAFNGTKNYPGKALIHYLESIGVKFGENLNAYTGFDETVYTLMDVPTTRNGIIDSCLLILHDWSNNIALENQEIDNERGVIHEEWRGNQNASMRMFEKVLPKVLPNRYGHRLPIGTMDVVLNFKYDELKAYYKKWYRPDLQGLIIVGDIDVDYVEAKIKEQFADVPAPVNPAERVYTEIADNAEPIVAIATDPEATSTAINISYKRDVAPAELRASANYFVISYLNSMVEAMFAERIAEIMQKPNAPFLGISMGYGRVLGLAVTKDALSFDIAAKEGQYKQALFAAIAEIKRARDFGFTAGEYDRARTNFLKGYDEAIKSKANRRNAAFAEEYKDYFLNGGSIAGIDIEHQLVNSFAPEIPLEVVNQYFQELAKDENMLMFMLAPEKEGIKNPTEAELLADYRAAFDQKVEPLKEEVSNEKLIEKLPKKGKITKVEKNLPYDVTCWTLSNGSKVYLKKTNFKENQIILSGISPGGWRMFDTKKEATNLKVFGAVTGIGGVANFSPTQLAKALTGRSASAGVGVNEFTENVSGASTNADVETMFQLLYLNMTAPRSDAEAYEAFKQRTIEGLRSAKANPMSSVSDTITNLLYPNRIIGKSLKEEDFDKISYEHIMKLHKERLADAGDFSYFIIGTFDEETLKPLVEQYIASLPNLKRGDKSHYNKADAITNKGRITHFVKEMDTKTANVFDVFVSKVPYTLESRLKMNILNEILSQQYTKTIREDEGGTYGVGVDTDVRKNPEGEALIVINFQTDPEKAEYLNNKAKNELKEMAKKGINREYFEKTVENMKKNYTESQHENSYWLGIMMSKFYYKKDDHANYLKTLESITPESIQAYLADFLKNHRYFEMVVTSPGKEAKK